MVCSLVREHQVRLRAHDINERKKMEEQLYYIARHDALTELPNRSLFMERLAESNYKSAKRNSFFSLLFIDIDGFKAVNDTNGHDVGDKLFIALHNGSLARYEGHGTVGRLGGDEFLIILDNLNSPSEVRYYKSIILAQFKMVFKFGDVYLNISPSIGIANYPEHGKTDHLSN